MNFLIDTDRQLFLFLNGIHGAFGDFVMYWLSNRIIWLPLYLLLIYYLIIEYRKKSYVMIIMAFVLIGLSDQLSVQLFKEMFHRLRPCHEPLLQNLVHLVDGCGGQYGFISSHASNTFALAVYMFGFLPRRWMSWGMIIWAFSVSYSRIYLGVHYPGDVLVGALLGILLGYLLRKLAIRLVRPGL